MFIPTCTTIEIEILRQNNKFIATLVSLDFNMIPATHAHFAAPLAPAEYTQSAPSMGIELGAMAVTIFVCYSIEIEILRRNNDIYCYRNRDSSTEQ